jgi:mannose-6-phosphate isomerase
MSLSLTALLLQPQYRDYVWGGQRLRPGKRTAEAWMVHENNRIASGALAGETLAQAATKLGAVLLGRRPVARTGLRFPLLIKLLDCAAWLSLQVHPDNAHAVRLEGPGNFGKTEAWHILEAEPGAELLGGLRPGTDAAALEQAIRRGTLLEMMQRLEVHTGDSLLIPAGMIHALGPGLLVYEVQQVSDITYRVYDWDRPASEGRALHIEKSIAAADPAAVGALVPQRPLAEGERRPLVTCEFFTLDLLGAANRPFSLDTGGESFHAVTVFEGAAVLEGDGWQQPLSRFQTALIPAACGAYRLRPDGAMKALLARV